MKNKFKDPVLAACIVAFLVAANAVYIVDQTEQAIVLQFGEPVREIKEPGLKIKIPFIQFVSNFT